MATNRPSSMSIELGELASKVGSGQGVKNQLGIDLCSAISAQKLAEHLVNLLYTTDNIDGDQLIHQGQPLDVLRNLIKDNRFWQLAEKSQLYYTLLGYFSLQASQARTIEIRVLALAAKLLLLKARLSFTPDKSPLMQDYDNTLKQFLLAGQALPELQSVLLDHFIIGDRKDKAIDASNFTPLNKHEIGFEVGFLLNEAQRSSIISTLAKESSDSSSLTTYAALTALVPFCEISELQSILNSLSTSNLYYNFLGIQLAASNWMLNSEKNRQEFLNYMLKEFTKSEARSEGIYIQKIRPLYQIMRSLWPQLTSEEQKQVREQLSVYTTTSAKKEENLFSKLLAYSNLCHTIPINEDDPLYLAIFNLLNQVIAMPLDSPFSWLAECKLLALEIQAVMHFPIADKDLTYWRDAILNGFSGFYSERMLLIGAEMPNLLDSRIRQKIVETILSKLLASSFHSSYPSSALLVCEHFLQGSEYENILNACVEWQRGNREPQQPIMRRVFSDLTLRSLPLSPQDLVDKQLSDPGTLVSIAPYLNEESCLGAWNRYSRMLTEREVDRCVLTYDRCKRNFLALKDFCEYLADLRQQTSQHKTHKHSVKLMGRSFGFGMSIADKLAAAEAIHAIITENDRDVFKVSDSLVPHKKSLQDGQLKKIFQELIATNVLHYKLGEYLNSAVVFKR